MLETPGIHIAVKSAATLAEFRFAFILKALRISSETEDIWKARRKPFLTLGKMFHLSTLTELISQL